MILFKNLIQSSQQRKVAVDNAKHEELKLMDEQNLKRKQEIIKMRNIRSQVIINKFRLISVFRKNKEILT